MMCCRPTAVLSKVAGLFIIAIVLDGKAAQDPDDGGSFAITWHHLTIVFSWQVAAISGARPDMSGAQNAHSQVGQASMLMDGLRMSSILWALLSATPVRLIDTCLKVVRPCSTCMRN